MTVPLPRSAEDRLQDMAREVAACRDEVVHCTHDLHALLLEHDVQTAAYRIVSGERDEMRRCLVAVAEAFPDSLIGARARRLLARTSTSH